MAFASQEDAGATRVLAAGFEFAAVLYAANILHSVGHVIAGRAVGAPVEVVLVTSTRDVMVYTQPGTAAPARSRLGRALGGPAANLAAGCVLMLAGHVTEASRIIVAGWMNVGISVWTLMPVPSLDGWVIWSILTRSRRGNAA